MTKDKALEQDQFVDTTKMVAQKQEPVRVMGFNCVCGRRMEVSAEQGVIPAPQRQPLTDEQIQQCWLQQTPDGLMSGGVDFARAIEAAHGIKEKNT